MSAKLAGGGRSGRRAGDGAGRGAGRVGFGPAGKGDLHGGDCRDIDKAIEIYSQIVKDAEAQRPQIAEAQYRLGVCLLKKGQKDKARDAFDTLVRQYSEQKGLVVKAQAELEKLVPAPSQADLVLGPVIERTVNDDGAGTNFLIDLDTDRLFTRRRSWQRAARPPHSSGCASRALTPPARRRAA